jgi:hypothetical protein
MRKEFVFDGYQFIGQPHADKIVNVVTGGGARWGAILRPSGMWTLMDGQGTHGST